MVHSVLILQRPQLQDWCLIKKNHNFILTKNKVTKCLHLFWSFQLHFMVFLSKWSLVWTITSVNEWASSTCWGRQWNPAENTKKFVCIPWVILFYFFQDHEYSFMLDCNYFAILVSQISIVFKSNFFLTACVLKRWSQPGLNRWK